jgi:parallel beta-helix repeat protein
MPMLIARLLLTVTLFFTITGNIMKNIKSKGIYLTGRNTGSSYMKTIILSNNTVTDCGQHGIGTDYCEQVNVTNNQVHYNRGTGIWLYRSSDVIANGNICFNNNS